jgi:hypothetical protein
MVTQNAHTTTTRKIQAKKPSSLRSCFAHRVAWQTAKNRKNKRARKSTTKHLANERNTRRRGDDSNLLLARLQLFAQCVGRLRALVLLRLHTWTTTMSQWYTTNMILCDVNTTSRLSDAISRVRSSIVCCCCCCCCFFLDTINQPITNRKRGADNSKFKTFDRSYRKLKITKSRVRSRIPFSVRLVPLCAPQRASPARPPSLRSGHKKHQKSDNRNKIHISIDVSHDCCAIIVRLLVPRAQPTPPGCVTKRKQKNVIASNKA